MNKLKRFLKTVPGNFAACLLIIVVVQGFLNQDFWNYGQQTLYFGWMPGSFLYRFLFLFVICPISLWLLIKFCWIEYDSQDDTPSEKGEE